MNNKRIAISAGVLVAVAMLAGIVAKTPIITVTQQKEQVNALQKLDEQLEEEEETTTSGIY